MPKRSPKAWSDWLQPNHFLRFYADKLHENDFNVPFLRKLAEEVGATSIHSTRVWDAIAADPELAAMNHQVPRPNDFTAFNLWSLFTDCWTPVATELGTDYDLDYTKIYRQFSASAAKRDLRLLWERDHQVIVAYVYHKNTPESSLPDLPDLRGPLNPNKSIYSRPPMLDDVGPWLLSKAEFVPVEDVIGVHYVEKT